MDQYFLLGRSGLRMSRLALGTMNFGTGAFHAAYGLTEEKAVLILHRYLEASGNFIDTAGESEEMPGRLIAGVREKLVLTSKFTNSVEPGDPNAGGSGRKHMIRAVEASLRRLRTTTWTCSCCTPGTGSRRSRRCCARSTIWPPPARSGTRACPTCRPGTPPARRPWPRPTGGHR